ncbi:SecDF P1 head subdomain-containing protein [Allopusillimonas ginsengisoli]|uniref:SecDF P1 head subdomain-containing protein n=1 Tax=Allopusillimonas ginsengisoli TaxID=453575 RepID=UPI0026A3A9FB
MMTARTLARVLAPISLAVLAACQTTSPTQKTAPDSSAQTATPAQTAATQAESQTQAQSQGAPVAVFLADTAARNGWTPVDIDSGKLFVNPQPVLTRDDLSGVQAGTSKDGAGLLALQLNDSGKAKIKDATTKNPNLRLALVVGRTMLAAPGYTTPVMSDQLIFAVGSEQNANAAARAIAGVPQDGTGDAQQPPAPAQGQTPKSVPR